VDTAVDEVDRRWAVADEPEVWVVAGSFACRPEAAEQLGAILAKYVVLTRMRDACRNVDLAASATQRGHFLVVEKWDDADAARDHLDAPETVDMARAAVEILVRKPDLDLYEGVSAHDLE
jgi:quinol monooxygenase YgiN